MSLVPAQRTMARVSIKKKSTNLKNDQKNGAAAGSEQVGRITVISWRVQAEQTKP